ncbi:TIGR03857 family LLM class F420-dependent oxidoreductase [Nocardia farcinica]|uniref:TIGR03857 family LLM class F420-dependent oxidoreductase n=1 Tax=Nocardia farcinica TaxID=37329 RepID=UPI0018946055|nr:TIGR03857 family LLM class F420-dependent oxidoreductase [Nocardia farcinica]MBF6419791.1 TIGR03857 family LLM class F420-dependent oxidoreductase [Nocardia farcinica]MBF6431268.1 TIGR03857 family LLM class F420-dependent oxidoreductase [Nocardia farcinica]MBF6501782.1 TIGR03857 family LLM class F420-dependent oxidoreductase [Nocardia farcinica]
MSAVPRFPELGCYGLAGHATTPRALLDEVRAAEELGFGSIFLSERFTTKEAVAMAAAAGAVSARIGIGTAATNHNTRHPVVTAAAAATLHRLTEGRYALGLGRGFDLLFDVLGIPRVTSAQLADVVGLYRTLWRGGTVVGHDGPAGRYPLLRLDPGFDEDIPILLTAIGEHTLRLAGRIADGVVLHTFFTDDTTRRAVRTIRAAAAAAGRDPDTIRIWSVLVTVDDRLDEATWLRRLAGRLGTYLQGYGEVLVRANGWDPEVLHRFRADPLVTGSGGALDAVADTATLRAVRALLPDEWLAAAATGTPERCAARIADQFAAGVTGVILHGATPAELAPVLAAWERRRDPARFAGLPANPGRTTA